jgi:hypothetical protein
MARTAYDKAFRVNPADARLLYERDQLWKRLGEKPAKRLRELEKHPQLFAARRFERGTLRAAESTGRHVEAMQLLAKRKFQPWEGGEGAVRSASTSARNSRWAARRWRITIFRARQSF